ncbi:MAG: SprT-like domain-containing protein [Cyanobacteria bacterium P01_A01_bin.40]
MNDWSTKTPTQELWESYEAAFDFFNQMLFDGELPQCVLNFSCKGRANGAFTPARWEKQIQGAKAKTSHEISLNPALLQQSIDQIMSVLVRLMVHLWQYQQGTASDHQGYHNRYWSEKMAEIGLPATHDGTIEGRKSGYKMQHWIKPEGKFAQALKEMPQNYFPWQGEVSLKKHHPPARIKYICPVCNNVVMAGKNRKMLCIQTEECEAARAQFQCEAEVRVVEMA